MVWIAALALAALNSQALDKKDISCNLAPFLGRGSSSEGTLDSLNGLGFGCRMALYSGQQWSLGPRLDLTEQRWTVFREAQGTTFFTSYQARSLGLGVSLDYAFHDRWSLSYSLGWARGQGSQDQNISTPNSMQNLHLSRMSQQAVRHELLVMRRSDARFAFLAGVQYESARQGWDTLKGRLERQDVEPGNRLTLTSGTGADLPTQATQAADYRAFSFKIGLQMQVYSSL